MTTTYNDYIEVKKAFFKKHNNEFTTHTSSLDEYNGYHKEYVFEDGAIWYEVNSIEYVEYEVEVKMVKIKEQAKMLRTEFWSSDDARSSYYYERY